MAYAPTRGPIMLREGGHNTLLWDEHMGGTMEHTEDQDDSEFEQFQEAMTTILDEWLITTLHERIKRIVSDAIADLMPGIIERALAYEAGEADEPGFDLDGNVQRPDRDAHEPL